MAISDYRTCDMCDGKAFYDVHLNYSYPGESFHEQNVRDRHYGLERVGDWVVLCTECAKTHRVVIVRKAPEREE